MSSIGDQDVAKAVRDGRITRRTAVRGGSVALAAGLVAATGSGCFGGDDDDSTKAASGSSGGEPKRGGDLVLGITGGTDKDSFNPFNQPQTIDHARCEQIFDAFGTLSPKGDNELVVAESIEPNASGDEWTLRLKDGLEFHNGKTAGAEDVKFTLEFALDPKNGAQVLPQLADVDLAATKALDKRTLRIKLKRQNGIFNYALAYGGFNPMYLIPVGFDPSKPVGTGPFKLSSFTAGRETVLERFENYWDSGKPYLSTVKVLDFADTAAKVNALIAGQVLAIDGVPDGQIEVIKRNGDLKLLSSQTGGLRALHMDCTKAPWTDVRARQALKLALDRDQLLSQALAGHGEVAYDIPGKFTDPAYPQDYTKPRDVEKATSLLKASGLADTPVRLTQADVASGLLPAAELMPAQLQEAGFKIELDKVDANTLYGDRYTKWQLMGDWWGAKPYLLQVQQALLPTSTYNLTHWDDDEFFGLLDKAVRTPDPQDQGSIVREMMQLDSERGGMAVWAFPETSDSYSAKVSGFAPHVGGIPLANYRLKDVWFV